MLPADKTNFMKSTLKITLGTQGNLNKPVIKIVQPIEVINPTELDEHVVNDDDRDTMIKNFLQFPMNPWLNDWFGVQTRFPIPLNSDKIPSHYITTIAAIEEEDLFQRFKDSIINRTIPYADCVRINRGEVPQPEHGNMSTRNIQRIDLSVQKHEKITDFFEWLESVDKPTWEEQQPDGSQLK